MHGRPKKNRRKELDEAPNVARRSNMPFARPLVFHSLPKIRGKNTKGTPRPNPRLLLLKCFVMKGGKSKAESRKADSRLAVKKKSKKEKKAAKDPNKPKRPPSAFFVFMEDFRKQYKEKHPNNKSVAAVGKAGGDKWKSLSDEEKAPFVAKAEKRKEEYERKMEAYNRKLAGGGDDESDKSKSEVNDDEDEEVSGEEEEDDD
ncbi:HMG1/2-like protein [Sesamum alatum]|uniref:HMG1/2-like protein n=1 Tax=Sesamum alatum TaxID=300844 RepID=A0AAE1YPC7_9LAMI|nr:HMG1/2-like protein [Sesamum alatum]